MEKKDLIIAISLSVSVVILSVISALVVGSLTSSPALQCTDITLSSNDIVLTQFSATLSPIDEGITSSEVKSNNDTWIDTDGVDDFVLSERYDTISFWYMNSTSVDWIFVVNSSGTLYVDGVLGTPVQFPVYDDGANMFLGQTGAAAFFNGSFDDFRGYASPIDADLVNLTYLGGRF